MRRGLTGWVVVPCLLSIVHLDAPLLVCSLVCLFALLIPAQKLSHQTLAAQASP